MSFDLFLAIVWTFWSRFRTSASIDLFISPFLYFCIEHPAYFYHLIEIWQQSPFHVAVIVWKFLNQQCCCMYYESAAAHASIYRCEYTIFKLTGLTFDFNSFTYMFVVYTFWFLWNRPMDSNNTGCKCRISIPMWKKHMPVILKCF